MVPYSLVAKINEYLINHNWLTELFLLIRGATEQDFWMAGFRRDNVISQLVSCPATSKGCFFFFFEISIPCAWVQETNIGLLPPCLPFWDRSFFTFHNKRMIGFRGSCHRIEAGFCYKRRNLSRWDVAFQESWVANKWWIASGWLGWFGCWVHLVVLLPGKWWSIAAARTRILLGLFLVAASEVE